MEEAVQNQMRLHESITATLDAVRLTQQEVCRHWEKGLRDTQEWMVNTVESVRQQVKTNHDEIPQMLLKFWEQRGTDDTKMETSDKDHQRGTHPIFTDQLDSLRTELRQIADNTTHQLTSVQTTVNEVVRQVKAELTQVTNTIQLLVQRLEP